MELINQDMILRTNNDELWFTSRILFPSTDVHSNDTNGQYINKVPNHSIIVKNKVNVDKFISSKQFISSSVNSFRKHNYSNDVTVPINFKVLSIIIVATV